MGEVLAVAILPHRNGLVEDIVTNTFVFGNNGVAPNATDLDAIEDAVTEFYTTAKNGQGSSLGAYLHSDRARNALACEVKLYDISAHLDGSPHGAPISTTTFTLPGTATGSYPSQSAYCITLEAVGRATQPVEEADGPDPGSAPDRPMQRYTGRIYLGPLKTAAGVTDAVGITRPSPAFMADCRLGIEAMQLHVAANSPNLYLLGVWSRTDEVVRDVDRVSSDDTFDTQRRRGASPTVRERLIIAP